VKSAPREYASLIVEHDGGYSWGENLTLREPPSGTPVLARAYDATDHLVDAQVEVTLTELADFDGVLATLPVPDMNWASIEIAGQRVPVR
jgi:hypothetical protein